MQLISKTYKRSILLLITSICVICLALFLFIAISVNAQNQQKCTAVFVETIPEDMIYSEEIISTDTHEEFLQLINSAQNSIDIASYYWSLQGRDVMPDPVPESSKGEDVLQALLNAGKFRSVKIRITVNDDTKNVNNSDLSALSAVAEIRKLNFPRLVGAGILHTKFILVDSVSFYIGSTNMDWRALTHVKELGLIARNCPDLGADLANIFNVYWLLGAENETIPSKWPDEFTAQFNRTNAQNSVINNQNYEVYFSSSPAALCPPGRTDELETVLSIINSAQQYIYIAVMDYYPMFLYSYPNEYWPLVDNALRKAVIERNVQIRFMASEWSNTRPTLSLFLKSLAAINGIKGFMEVKFFVVPQFNASQPEIPFTRVNHNKYMVTETMVYVSTNNWSADYFVSTGGASIVVNATETGEEHNLQAQLKAIFERDWVSVYTKDL